MYVCACVASEGRYVCVASKGRYVCVADVASEGRCGQVCVCVHIASEGRCVCEGIIISIR